MTPPLRNADHQIRGTPCRSSLYSNQKVGRLQQLRAEGQNRRRRTRPTLLQPLRHPRAHDHSCYPPPRARSCAFQTSTDLTSRIRTEEWLSDPHCLLLHSCICSFLLDLHAGKETRSVCGDCGILCRAGRFPRQRLEYNALAEVRITDYLALINSSSGFFGCIQLAASADVVGIWRNQNCTLHLARSKCGVLSRTLLFDLRIMFCIPCVGSVSTLGVCLNTRTITQQETRALSVDCDTQRFSIFIGKFPIMNA